MDTKKPPYSLTDRIFKYSNEISRVLGRYEGVALPKLPPKLRRKNRIKTIQASLEIEGNALTEDQVTAILDNKRVIGSARDIREVQNAIALYDMAGDFKIHLRRDFLRAHRILMKGLVEHPGQLRSKGVGILQGKKIVHMAPKHTMVPALIDNLFDYLKAESQNELLIASCVFHYELEFIHPFSDGNGRMGRFWQHIILMKKHPLFEYVPFESVIRDKQKAYYKALGEADKEGESTKFIEFCLESILSSLTALVDNVKERPHTTESRIDAARERFGEGWFSRKDYLSVFKTISSATASRDLVSGVKDKIIERRGEKARTEYRFR